MERKELATNILYKSYSLNYLLNTILKISSEVIVLLFSINLIFCSVGGFIVPLNRRIPTHKNEISNS